MKALKCHECSGIMRRGTRPSTITYKGKSVTIDQPGWYCESCDEAVLSKKDILATEPVFLDLKARVEGVLTPTEVKAIRKRLKLSQRKAGEILGGGVRAFQKYESGKTMVSQPMSNLLRLLRNDPGRLDELFPREASIPTQP